MDKQIAVDGRVVKAPVPLMAAHPQWCAFPIKRGEKAPPLFGDNLNSASNDRVQVGKWEKQFPGCNWGWSLPKSSLIVVDVDVREGKRGRDTFDRLQLEYGELPETFTVQSPSGGFHYYYNTTATVRYRKGMFGQDVDSPGYVLAPGSRLLTGGSYSVFLNAPVADAPDWFADVLGPTAGDNTVEQIAETELDTDDIIARAIDYLKNDAKPSIQGQNGDATMVATYGVLKDMGVSYDNAVRLIDEHYNPRCEPPWQCGEGDPKDRHDVKGRNAYSYLKQNAPGASAPEVDFSADPVDEEDTKPKPDEPIIRKNVKVIAGKFGEAMVKVQRAVGPQVNLPDAIFKRDRRLVHLSRNLMSEGVKLKHFERNALVIQDATRHWLANRFEKSVQFLVPAGEDDTGKMTWRVVNAPLMMIDRIIGDSTNWPEYRTLHATTETPTLRSDGTVLDKPGYDESTGLFYDPGDTVFPKIKNKPSEAEGRAAVAKLVELMTDFPFADGVSKAVALALMLTTVTRRSMETAPVYIIDGDEAEAGKTTLGKVCGALATGRDIQVQAYATNVEERDKLLPALLLGGSPFLLFDNLPDGTIIEGAEMEKVITSATYESRPFGKNDTTRTMPTNATMVFTGIKMSAQGAMTTRGLVVRLVPDKPLAERIGKFKFPDIVKHTIDNRPEYVAAILTALRAYLVHGVGKVEKKDGDRFPDWSRLIRSAVIWYGFDDPLKGGEKLRRDDPVKEAQLEVLGAWWRKFADKRVTGRELSRAAEVREAIGDAIDAGVIRVRLGSKIGSHMAARLVETLTSFRDAPVEVIKLPRAKGVPQEFRLKLKPHGRADWAGDTAPSSSDFDE